MVLYAGIGKQTGLDTEVDPNIFLPLIRESVNVSREPLLAETAIYRVPSEASIPPVNASGEIELPLDVNSIVYLMYGVLGNIETTGSESPYTHTITPVDEGRLPLWTLEIGHDSKARRFIDAVVRRLSIECPARELVSVTAEFLARKPTVQSSQLSPSYNTRKFISFKGGTITLDGSVQANISSITVEIENDIPDDAFAVGDVYLADLYTQGLTISGSFDMFFTDWSEFQRFISGSKTGVEPDGVGFATLQLKFTDPDEDSMYLQIDLGEIVYNSAEVNIDRRDMRVLSVEYRAIKWDPANNKPIKVTVANEVSSI